RVVGFSRAMQGWAELCALPTHELAPVPDAVSLEDAATLPVAGLTALYGLERGERLLASPVLITGATGGTGLFACALANLMGAHVVAHVRREEQTSV
ncbi:MAG: alcohol dehydrogenase, partial [Gammaproteobacteria bacterium]|nr:alcohol dehydrogenase [Gammaproteobacteria bacterium]